MDLEGLRARIRNHVDWAKGAAAALAALPGVSIVTPPALSLFTFALDAGDAATRRLLARINEDGRIYLTQTRRQARYVIRVQVGQFDCTAGDVAMIATVVAELTAVQNAQQNEPWKRGGPGGSRPFEASFRLMERGEIRR